MSPMFSALVIVTVLYIVALQYTEDLIVICWRVTLEGSFNSQTIFAVQNVV